MLRVSVEDLDCTVEAGVTRKQLNQHLRDTGLFFPIDPGADASLGGMAATRASGTNAVRYGTMRENVLALEVVLADGRVIRTARRARKSAAGYDLTRLFVGSEGTLGVITEVSLRLYGIPEAIRAAVCAFPSLDAAVDTVVTTIQAGMPVARIELLDEVQMDAVNRYSKLDYAVAPTLFFEFHGTEQRRRGAGGDGEAFAGEQWRHRIPLGRRRPRSATSCGRRGTTPISRRWRCGPAAGAWATDVCVPISRLAECIAETKARHRRRARSWRRIVGHVGDGNFHLSLHARSGKARGIRRGDARSTSAWSTRAIAMDGTCTGEHGVGLGQDGFPRRRAWRGARR